MQMYEIISLIENAFNICKTFDLMANFKLSLPGIKQLQMITIRSDEGHYFDLEDSANIVKQRLTEDFSDFESFWSFFEVLKPDYWGDCQINGTNDEYVDWLIVFARKTLK